MNVLFVSNDPSMFNEQSPARVRMRAYASAIGQLHIVSRASEGAKECVDGPLTLHPVTGSRLSALLRFPRIIRSLIIAHGIEVVSAQDPFEHGMAAVQGSKGTKARVHIQVHTDFLSPWFIRGTLRSSLLNRVRRFLADRVLPSASGIRVVSKRIKDSLIKKYGKRIPDPIILPIAVEAQLPEAVPLPSKGFSFAFITVARLEPEKRTEDILEALALLLDHREVGLIVVGEGSERKRLERLAASLRLTERVLFTGWRTDSWGMMRNAQAYIQASAYEGYGRTLLEAALAGLPIVSTDVGIVGDILKEGESVLRVPPGEPQALSEAIRRLVENTELRERLAKSAEQAALEHVSDLHAPATLVRDTLLPPLTPPNRS